MDPQQRLLLEVVLGGAGAGRASTRERCAAAATGVFVGADRTTTTGRAGRRSPHGASRATCSPATAASVLSGRVVLRARPGGPGGDGGHRVLVVAGGAAPGLPGAAVGGVHAGAGRRRDGDGHPGGTSSTSPGSGGLAADGRCKAFAAAADGTGWGEGVGRAGGGAAVRRPPQRAPGAGGGARQRGQPGRRVQRADRAERPVPAAGDPRRAGQRRAVARPTSTRWRRTGPGPRSATRSRRRRCSPPTGRDARRRPPLWLGSVKSNIGHTQAAAGRRRGDQDGAGACGTGCCRATLHVDAPSPHVDWSAGAVRLLTEPAPWPAAGTAAAPGRGLLVRHQRHQRARHPRGGAGRGHGRRHAARRRAGGAAAGRWRSGGAVAWPVSARSAAGLAAQAGRLAEFAGGAAGPGPGRRGAGRWRRPGPRLEHRAVVTGRDRGELLAGLAAVAAGEPAARAWSPGRRAARAKAAFVFTGQGAQRAGMGRELHAAYPVFAARLRRGVRGRWSRYAGLAGRGR